MFALRKFLPLLVMSLTANCGRMQRHHDDDAPNSPNHNDDQKDGETQTNTQVNKDTLLTTADPWASERWVMKASRILRQGRELLPGESIEALAQMKKSDVIAKFMSDPLFGDTVLNFNLYFLGFANGSLKMSNGQYKFDVYNFPQAIQAAQAVVDDGDYFSLFQPETPLSLSPLMFTQLPKDMQPAPGTTAPRRTPQEIRKIITDRLTAEIEGTLLQLETPETFDKAAFCQKNDTVSWNELVQDTGLTFNLTVKMDVSGEWFSSINTYCSDTNSQPSDLKTLLTKIHTRLPALIAMINSLGSEIYHPSSVKDIKLDDLKTLGLGADFQYTFLVWNQLQNSSTNYNRKRAAYVLKRYFCDDLTPISLALPDQHTTGRHASDPSCQSCHYKLDPMAGFFKDRGVIGIDFGKFPFIQFDDGATMDRQDFANSWHAPGGTSRTWDIAYVRSPDNASLNTYGESLDDLFNIINTAPEVKQCLVRRMFEYFVARDQVVDGNYLTALADKFTEESKENSSQAFKNTIARLLESQTFSTPDPVSTQCYDFALDSTSEPIHSPLPCQVAHVISRNCASCHSSQGASGGLDLTGWTTLEDGTQTFPHKKGGRQVDRSTTMQSIYDRITSTNKAKRMPLDRDISSGDLEQLFQWVNKVLAEKGDH